MKVLVTGGTGFVGSHACRKLMSCGHDLRLLVRSADKARGFYSGGVSNAPEIVQGDITAISSVKQAVQGCDAVVHTAAATPMQIESIEKLFDINVGGTKHVVDAALDEGIEHIICLSSITAIFNEDGARVTPDAPPNPSKMPYGRSKVKAELYLRGLQDQGAPIAILYPGGVIGPDDPSLSDSCKAIKHRIENGFRIFADGGMQYIDVRDLADFICSLVATGGGGRFLVPGVYSTWTELADILEDVSGCRLQRIPARGWKLRLLGRLLDLVRKFKTIDAPISAETMRYATLWPEIQNTAEFERRGLSLRDPRVTFDDTLRWMVKAGYLSSDQCPNYE